MSLIQVEETILNWLQNFVFYSLLVTILLKLGHWLYDYFDAYSAVNQSVVGPPALPFIGNARQLLTEGYSNGGMLKQQIEFSKEYKNQSCYRIWTGTHAHIIFHKCDDDLEFILNQICDEKSSSLSSSSLSSSFGFPCLGPTGLLPQSSRRKRLIASSFHRFDTLNDFFDVMNEQAQTLIDVLLNNNKLKQQLNIFKYLGLCTLDILFEIAMGKTLNSQTTDGELEYVKAVEKQVDLINERIMDSPLQWFDIIYNNTTKGKQHLNSLDVLQKFTRQLIQERETELERINFNLKSPRKRGIAFLDMLLEAKHKQNNCHESASSLMTFEDIQEEVNTFLFEGHEFTQAALAWSCQLIGSHAHVQAKLHNELEHVFGTNKRTLRNEDLDKLNYLECVIKETLRLFPSVPFFSRTIKREQIISPGGHTLPKGMSSASVFTYMIHRDDRFYPDPELFNPDRFSSQKNNNNDHLNRSPYAFMPFSADKQQRSFEKFAMMEMKVVLANLLRRFHLESVKTIDELKPVAHLTLMRPLNNDLPMKLKPKF